MAEKMYEEVAPSGVRIYSCKPIAVYGYRDTHKKVFAVTSWFILHYNYFKKFYRQWKAQR